MIRGRSAQDGQSHPGDRHLPDAVLVARVSAHGRAVQSRPLQIGHDPVGLCSQLVRVTAQFVRVERFSGGDLLVQVGVGRGRVGNR